MATTKEIFEKQEELLELCTSKQDDLNHQQLRLTRQMQNIMMVRYRLEGYTEMQAEQSSGLSVSHQGSACKVAEDRFLSELEDL